MSPDSTGSPSWDVVAAELRACREQQKQTWGELDSALIGRYLAGEVSNTERKLVEASLEDHPELRVLTEIVSDVLADCSPVASVEAPAEPRLLSFSSAKPARKSKFQRSQRLFALAAAACLLLGLGLALEQRSSNPSAGGFSLSDTSLMASNKGKLFNTARKADVNLTSSSSPARPEQELVALANDLVEKNEFEKAAQILFDTPMRDAAPSPPAVPVAHTSQLNEAVVNLTERYLNSMPGGFDDDARKTERHGFAPAGGAASAIKFVAATDKKSNETRGRILNNSLPYLLDGVKQQSNRTLQQRSANALGRMGSYAAPVVPQLAETLRRSECPIQQTVLTEVFKNLGPEARPAAKDLEYVAGKCCKQVQPHAQEAPAAVRMPDWIGVRDNARVLDEKVKHRVNQRIRELARVHHVQVVAETVSKLPDSTMDTYFAYKGENQRAAYLSDVARKRSHDVGADRGVYLLICMDPPSVQVALGDQSNAGKPAASLAINAARDRLEKSVRTKEPGQGYDKDIEEVVRSIEQALAK